MMSEITLNPAQTQATINDPNTSSYRGQSSATTPQSTQSATSSVPTDSVQLSAAAQAVASPSSGATNLSDADAQKTAANLRTQIGVYGLSASLAQNQTVLSLLRRPE
jgi:hypothetical protein